MQRGKTEPNALNVWKQPPLPPPHRQSGQQCRHVCWPTEFIPTQTSKPPRPSSYLSNPVDLLLIRLGDVEDAGVRQGHRRGAFQRCVYGQLAETIVHPRHLAMHGPARDNAHLRLKDEDHKRRGSEDSVSEQNLWPTMQNSPKFNSLGPN